MDAPESTITLTHKQLIALGVSETLVDLLRFSSDQSNNMNAPEPTITLSRKQLIALGVSETLVDLLCFSSVQSNETALSLGRVSSANQRKSSKTQQVINSNPISSESRSAIKMNSIQANLNDLEPPFKKVKREQKEPEESGVKLNDLPELPFEKILSYLSLEDLIKARAVSRRWHSVIDSFRPKSLCISKCPISFFHEKSRWINGSFAQNFINCTKLGSFFQTFGQTFLSSLKHLHLCRVLLNAENTPASFAKILNSFDQLEKLGLYRINLSSELNRGFQLHLNLPMLKSVQLVQMNAIEKLTLDTPKLQEVEFVNGWHLQFKADLVYGESVEKLIIDRLDNVEVKKLKNLKYLYCGVASNIDSTLLSTLEQLNEIHLDYESENDVVRLFRQEERYGRVNLKIFLCGCSLNGPNDPAIDSLDYTYEEYLVCLAEKSRLAETIPFCNGLDYSTIEAVAPGQEIDLLNRFIYLEQIDVERRVQNVERFLNLLKNLKNNLVLYFKYSKGCNQPKQLFDRLPNSGIATLIIDDPLADLNFLFELKSLNRIYLHFSVVIEFIPKVLEELPFLTFFKFKYLNKRFSIEIDGPNQFEVSLDVKEQESKCVSDLNDAIEWISEKGIESKDEE